MNETRILPGTQYDLDLPRESTIKALRYLSDGRLLAVSTLKHGSLQDLRGIPNLIQVWEIGKASPLCEWVAASNGWNRISIHPRGSSIAISTNEDLSLRDVRSGQQLWVARPAALANDIQFSADGRFLATVGPYGLRDNLAFVDLWNVDSGANVFSASPGIQSCDLVSFSTDGVRLAVFAIHEDPSIGSLLVWSTDGHNLVNRVNHRGGQSAISFTPDGNFVVTSDGSIHFWNAENGDLVRTLEAKSGEVFGEVHFDLRDSTLVTNVKRIERMDTGPFSNELLKMFSENVNPFEILIPKMVEKLKDEDLSFGDLVRIEIGSSREMDRQKIHLSHPLQGSGYCGHARAMSPDGRRFAMALHTSVEFWRLDDEPAI
jgi:WD40 repeat protein